MGKNSHVGDSSEEGDWVSPNGVASYLFLLGPGDKVAADLPAPDSLVRFSVEPMQAQESVLLRAASESVEQNEEQLVRASVSFSESRSGRPEQE